MTYYYGLVNSHDRPWPRPDHAFDLDVLQVLPGRPQQRPQDGGQREGASAHREGDPARPGEISLFHALSFTLSLSFLDINIYIYIYIYISSLSEVGFSTNLRDFFFVSNRTFLPVSNFPVSLFTCLSWLISQMSLFCKSKIYDTSRLKNLTSGNLLCVKRKYDFKFSRLFAFFTVPPGYWVVDLYILNPRIQIFLF